MARSQFVVPLAGPVVQGVVGGVVILDQFTDSDATLLTAHTIAPTNAPGAVWLSYSWADGAIISGNRAAYGPTGGRQIMLVDVGNASPTIDAHYVLLAWARTASIAVRTFDDGAYWTIDIQTGLPGSISIVEFVNPTTTVRASASADNFVSEGDVHITLNGTTITATTHVLTTSYAGATMNQNVTRHGLHFEGAGAVEYDNFKVTL